MGQVRSDLRSEKSDPHKLLAIEGADHGGAGGKVSPAKGNLLSDRMFAAALLKEVEDVPPPARPHEIAIVELEADADDL